MPPVFVHRFTPRFRDLDALGHVNNAVYLTFLEETRVAFFRKIHGTRHLPRWPFVLKHAEVEYHRPVEFGDVLDVALSVTRWGKTSFTFAYEATLVDAGEATGVTAFTGRSTQVFVDAETGRPRAVPDEFRKRIEGSKPVG